MAGWAQVPGADLRWGCRGVEPGGSGTVPWVVLDPAGLPREKQQLVLAAQERQDRQVQGSLPCY